MIGNRRVLGAAVAAVLVASLGTLAGCASDEKPEVALTQKQVQAASVTLTVHDVNGAQVGQGSGILIAPRLVLTSAHLVAGKARWGVTSADGTTKVNGIRGMTYDWMDYDNSQNAHPRKHDVAVIYLDKPINLETYPKIAAEGLANNAQGTRLRSNGSQVLQLPQTFKKVVGFPHAYLTTMPSQESVEPGNAVLNEHNEIVGLVTGRGLTTGQMYVARTNDLTEWLSPKAQCGGRSNASVRTYGTPPPKPGCDTPGNGSSSGSTSGQSSGSTSGDQSSGNTSGGASSGSSGDQSSSGSSGASSGGTSGSSGQSSGSSGQSSGSSGQSSGGSSGGTDNPSCHDGGGHCHGNCHGVPNDNSSSGSSGSSGQSSGSSGQTSGGTSSGGTSSGGTSSGSSGDQSSSGSSGASSSGSSGSSGQSSGSSGQTSSSGGASSSGSSGDQSSSGSSGASSSGSSGSSGQSSGSSGQSSGSSGQASSSGGNSSGGSSGGSSSGGAGSENNGDDEACEGSHDNPETCPPEDDGCTGGSCGGAFAPDNQIDYGGCSQCSNDTGDSKLVVK